MVNAAQRKGEEVDTTKKCEMILLLNFMTDKSDLILSTIMSKRKNGGDNCGTFVQKYIKIAIYCHRFHF